MPDREKVIRALRSCSVQNDVGCQGCPYFGERKTYGHEWCTTSMAQDTLALLKEMEIVRCADCKYGSLWSDGNVIVCDKLSKTRSINWFCADGERRTDDA